MTMCYFAHDIEEGNSHYLYISRAYQSNQVFDIPDGSHQIIYLENLSINVTIKDELNSFDFVED